MRTLLCLFNGSHAHAPLTAEKSNESHVGTIRSSNSTTDSVQFSSPTETASTSSGFVVLPMFVTSLGAFDYITLHRVVKVLTHNLNRIIDSTHYPVTESKSSALMHRPISIGVQGLADALQAMRLPMESFQAAAVNTNIAETIYHAALEASCELAARHGSYSTWAGSQAYHGRLQYDLWGVTPSKLWEWSALKTHIRRHGLRNSLLIALPPPGPISSLTGVTPSFNPITRWCSISI